MINEQFVIDYLAYKAGRPLKVRELARALAIPDRDYTGFRIMIKETYGCWKTDNFEKPSTWSPCSAKSCGWKYLYFKRRIWHYNHRIRRASSYFTR